jgi:adenosylmethionine-8-amino-7-oxononanoate aminotransferase
MPSPKLTQILQQRGIEKGAFLRVVANRLCYSPPCTITREESERALDILQAVLMELKPEDLT